jgi:hypothetical protein
VTCNYNYNPLTKETSNALNTFVLSRHPHPHYYSDRNIRALGDAFPYLTFTKLEKVAAGMDAIQLS